MSAAHNILCDSILDTRIIDDTFPIPNRYFNALSFMFVG